MERLTDAEIAELERLEKAATRGPWYSGCEPHGPCAAKMYRNQILSTAQYPELIIAERPRYDCDTRKRTFDTMLFITAACNALPRLLAELRERRAAEKSDTCPHCEMRYADCFCGGEAKGGAK